MKNSKCGHVTCHCRKARLHETKRDEQSWMDSHFNIICMPFSLQWLGTLHCSFSGGEGQSTFYFVDEGKLHDKQRTFQHGEICFDLGRRRFYFGGRGGVGSISNQLTYARLEVTPLTMSSAGKFVINAHNVGILSDNIWTRLSRVVPKCTNCCIETTTTTTTISLHIYHKIIRILFACQISGSQKLLSV